MAAERSALERGQGGVVGDAEKRRQNGFAEHLGEGLAFLVAALSLAFEPVAEHLVEEDRGRAPTEDRGPVEWLRYRRGTQRLQALRHGDGFVGDGLPVGQARS